MTDTTRPRLLASEEGSPFALSRPEGGSDLVLVCEHASARLPARLGTLGLDDEALASHIAWDPGALAVARRLSDTFDAVLVSQRFSRLAYDCNRPPEAPSAVPVRSEIYAIPGNAALSADERAARVEEIYRPFQGGLAGVLATRVAAGRRSVLVTIHSFTPVYFGERREVEIGILHDSDSRLADAMLARAAAAESRFAVRRNEPYGPADGVTHTLVEHGLANGLANVMIEVRSDLIRDATGVEAVASFLADLIPGQAIGHERAKP